MADGPGGRPESLSRRHQHDVQPDRPGHGLPRRIPRHAPEHRRTYGVDGGYRSHPARQGNARREERQHADPGPGKGPGRVLCPGRADRVVDGHRHSAGGDFPRGQADRHDRRMPAAAGPADAGADPLPDGGRAEETAGCRRTERTDGQGVANCQRYPDGDAPESLSALPGTERTGRFRLACPRQGGRWRPVRLLSPGRLPAVLHRGRVRKGDPRLPRDGGDPQPFPLHIRPRRHSRPHRRVHERVDGGDERQQYVRDPVPRHPGPVHGTAALLQCRPQCAADRHGGRAGPLPVGPPEPAAGR